MQNPPKEHSHHESEPDVDGEAEFNQETDHEITAASPAPVQNSARLEKRRERRRSRRRRHSDDKPGDEKKDLPSEDVEDSNTGEPSASTVFTMPVLNLIPPPTTLISQTLARYKEKLAETAASESPTAVIEESYNQTTFQVPLEPEDLV